jgi:hypothetical protein
MVTRLILACGQVFCTGVRQENPKWRSGDRFQGPFEPEGRIFLTLQQIERLMLRVRFGAGQKGDTGG